MFFSTRPKAAKSPRPLANTLAAFGALWLMTACCNTPHTKPTKFESFVPDFVVDQAKLEAKFRAEGATVEKATALWNGDAARFCPKEPACNIALPKKLVSDLLPAKVSVFRAKKDGKWLFSGLYDHTGEFIQGRLFTGSDTKDVRALRLPMIERNLVVSLSESKGGKRVALPLRKQVDLAADYERALKAKPAQAGDILLEAITWHGDELSDLVKTALAAKTFPAQGRQLLLGRLCDIGMTKDPRPKWFHSLIASTASMGDGASAVAALRCLKKPKQGLPTAQLLARVVASACLRPELLATLPELSAFLTDASRPLVEKPVRACPAVPVKTLGLLWLGKEPSSAELRAALLGGGAQRQRLIALLDATRPLQRRALLEALGLYPQWGQQVVSRLKVVKGNQWQPEEFPLLLGLYEQAVKDPCARPHAFQYLLSALKTIAEVPAAKAAVLGLVNRKLTTAQGGTAGAYQLALSYLGNRAARPLALSTLQPSCASLEYQTANKTACCLHTESAKALTSLGCSSKELTAALSEMRAGRKPSEDCFSPLAPPATASPPAKLAGLAALARLAPTCA